MSTCPIQAGVVTGPIFAGVVQVAITAVCSCVRGLVSWDWFLTGVFLLVLTSGSYALSAPSSSVVP